jgi:hypothetical protein
VIYWPPEEWQIIRHLNEDNIPSSSAQESWSTR